MGMSRNRLRYGALACAGGLFLVLAMAIPGGGWHRAERTESAQLDAGGSAAAFLSRFWRYPLLPEGKAPAGYSRLTASLSPTACGRCHVQQYRDWRSSLHHATMGPGILWQFYLYRQSGANSCMRCHAPLAEQKALVAMKFHWPNVPSTPPPAYVPRDLAHQGLVCAACHVRAQRRYGPPPPRGWAAGDTPGLPHDGFVATAAFKNSRFCAACHQFPASGPALDGVPLENTYEEWRHSRFAREGVSCQDCHMPAGRHLWRGIHDPAMVRKAITVSLHVRRRGPRQVHVVATIVNSGAGHDFPTYSVPRVTARIDLMTPAGTVARQLASRIIQRRLNVALTRQFSDTRIKPGGHLVFGAHFAAPKGRGWHVRLRIVVDPEEWYIRMYRHYLSEASRLPAASLPLLRRALAHAQAERFLAYQKLTPVPPPTPKAGRVAN